AGGAGGIVAAGGREGGGERERVGGRVEVGGAPKPSLPPPRRCLKDSPADRQDDRRKPDGARDWIESFPVKSDHEKTDRRRRDEQEWEQGTGLPLFPGRDEPDSQFLENEKAENNDAGPYCQEHSPPPSKEKHHPRRGGRRSTPSGPGCGGQPLRPRSLPLESLQESPQIHKSGGDAERRADEGRRLAEAEPSPDPFPREVTRNDGDRKEES